MSEPIQEGRLFKLKHSQSKLRFKKRHSWDVEGQRQTVKCHGPFELEYNLSQELKVQNSVVFEMISFLPPGLTIPNEQYDPSIAMGTFKSYLKKSIDKFDFNSSEEKEGDEFKLLRSKSDQWQNDKPFSKSLVSEFKKYATEYRKFIKQIAFELRRLMLRENRSEKDDEHIDRLLKQAIWNWSHYRKFEQDIKNKIQNENLLSKCSYIDQYISDQFSLFQIHMIENVQLGNCQGKDWASQINEALKSEHAVRSRRDYPPLLRNTDEEASYNLMTDHLYTHSQTKKFVDSVLFLNVKDDGQFNSDSPWFAILAASVAMTLYLFSLLAIQWFFGLSVNEIFWILSAIFLYVIKDRVKEIVRKKLILGREEKKAHKVLKIENDGDFIGKTYEKLYYPAVRELDKSILKNRLQGSVANLQKTLLDYEHVQYYTKVKKIDELNNIKHIINEKIRVDLHPWMTKADGAKKKYLQYIEDEDEIKSEKIFRTYRFHILFRLYYSEKKPRVLLHGGEENVKWHHVEVSANRDKIISIRAL